MKLLDEVFLLEAVEVPQDGPRYGLVSWSVLTDEELGALGRGEVINLKGLHERLTVFLKQVRDHRAIALKRWGRWR